MNAFNYRQAFKYVGYAILGLIAFVMVLVGEWFLLKWHIASVPVIIACVVLGWAFYLGGQK